jgi:lon-related putative ATP-dependent protease
MLNLMTSKRARELRADELELALDEAGEVSFSTTDELEPLEDERFVGQARAIAAVELALGVHHAGYNVFVAGMSGLGKKRALRRLVADRLGRAPTPPDWVYVNNFQDSDRPIALSLRPGEGAKLKRDIGELVDRLAEELPQLLERDEARAEKQLVEERLNTRGRQETARVEELARSKGLEMRQLPGGIVLVPLREERPMSDEEMRQLSDSEREEIRQREKEVADALMESLSRHQREHRELGVRLKAAMREIVERHVAPPIAEIARSYDNPELGRWLASLQAHIVDNHEQFGSQQESREPALAMLLGVEQSEAKLSSYRVNVLVDNSGLTGAPVVVENAPTYKNLFGIIEHRVDRLGQGRTDYTRIKAGSLLRAAGGVLIFDLLDAMREPVVYKELKRAIRSGLLLIEDYDPLGLLSRSALKPEPIPLTVKLICTGPLLLFHMLYAYDEDFREIFKIKAEFVPEMERDPETLGLMGRLVRSLSGNGERVLPFRSDAVAELTRAAARFAGSRSKITAELERVADLAREASHAAIGRAAPEVTSEHVRSAIDARRDRSGWIAEKIRELVTEGAIRIDVDRKVTGQINGLAVHDLGDFSFGRPVRVTASVGVGAGGIVNIERESKLSGRTYDKGILILEGYLRNTYAGDRPLALSASLAMEQNYGMIDGDSASVAELLCLLSALAGIELRQDVAVTGSVNQRGQIQAIGGVNDKVEGFYDVCAAVGLSGGQGVLIPEANTKNLILRPDVVHAVNDGRFHVWSADRVDAALELLTGVPAEEVHRRVRDRLEQLGAILKQAQAPAERAPAAVIRPGDGSPDPRPTLPGSNRDRA